MENYHKVIKGFLKENNINASQIVLAESCHSVEEAAKAINASIDEFVKNICMVDSEGRLIVAVVKGKDRASTSRVGKVLKIDRPRLATEEEVLRHTGFPAGGVPSFGFEASFLIDSKVAELKCIYTGGGSPYSLIKMNVEEMVQINGGQVGRIRK
ncbi:aminoacyl-tRNA deacylase [Fictibacillus barbaricus]|uniref:YbaK/EbsC family protein n=1 Tax=Fictibacillus barbaricus TaxID=182136 RepID=A0ABS2ZG27_9BACL|nr:YbaK/EbsC family protein [Fictibacillus barbaricus]MBN3545569.1 YbaK/EbsC family protein [Fictibacillus barbaricus]GGB54417.1 hypothetical protein GCM10007199_20210 [Fictibacillus barbaricus]